MIIGSCSLSLASEQFRVATKPCACLTPRFAIQPWNTLLSRCTKRTLNPHWCNPGIDMNNARCVLGVMDSQTPCNNSTAMHPAWWRGGGVKHGMEWNARIAGKWQHGINGVKCQDYWDGQVITWYLLRVYWELVTNNWLVVQPVSVSSLPQRESVWWRKVKWRLADAFSTSGQSAIKGSCYFQASRAPTTICHWRFSERFILEQTYTNQKWMLVW